MEVVERGWTGLTQPHEESSLDLRRRSLLIALGRASYGAREIVVCDLLADSRAKYNRQQVSS